jgi:hypothetical protein
MSAIYLYTNKNRRYGNKTYNSLCQKITRDGINNPGKITTFLLERFETDNTVIITKQWYSEARIGTVMFSDWINNLITKGYLSKKLMYGKDGQEVPYHSNYQAGPVLSKYINKGMEERGRLQKLNDMINNTVSDGGGI